jgi:hypothetical protein
VPIRPNNELDEISQRESFQSSRRKRRVDPRHRLNAPGESGAELSGGPGRSERLIGDRLNGRQGVLHPMIEFAQGETKGFFGLTVLLDLALESPV